MHPITKLCADHLRAFSNNYGVTLKSAHAHELIAAFVGYKSNAAMRADTIYSIDNLLKSQILVLTPSQFINERRKCLEDLPFDLPETSILVEAMYTFLLSEMKLSCRIFPAWEHLAEALTNAYLQKYGDFILSYKKIKYIFDKPLYEFNPKIISIDNEILLTVTNRYYHLSEVHFQHIDLEIMIKLQRVAGQIGYAKPDISVVDVSNQLTDQKMVVSS